MPKENSFTATDVSEDVSRSLTTAQQVDDGRDAADPFKLPTQLRADVDADVASLGDTDLQTGSAEGDRAQAPGAQRRAITKLTRQLRGG